MIGENKVKNVIADVNLELAAVKVENNIQRQHHMGERIVINLISGYAYRSIVTDEQTMTNDALMMLSHQGQGGGGR